jgi:hypothetical protein
MKIIRPSSESEFSADDFRVTYLARRGEERIATGRPPGLCFVSPWQPAGTLAHQVFRAARNTREPSARARWPRRLLDPRRDLRRLRQAFRGGRLPGAAWGGISPLDIQLVRLGVESVVLSSRYALPGDEFSGSLRTPRRTRATVALHPLELGWPADHPRAVWEGIAGHADLFRTTPSGATVLSANYGLARGGLRLCRTCWALFIPPRVAWAQRHCDDCRALRPSVSHTRGGLTVRKQERWEKVLDRIRKRGLVRLELTTPGARETWRRDALTALHQVSTPAELEAWEDRVAPRGRAGRPRKTP